LYLGISHHGKEFYLKPKKILQYSNK